MDERPGVLCIGGHDPTGGAGIQADVETLSALGVRAFTLVTCLTAQDTRNVAAVLPTPATDFRRQYDTLMADVRPEAIKIGLLGSVEIAGLLGEWLIDFAGPIVLDPVLRAGGGEPLAGEALQRCLLEGLVPRSTLLTPNRAELTQLSRCVETQAAAQSLLEIGANGVLVTGADAAAAQHHDQVSNTLYTSHGAPQTWNWPRLPHVYHGSGCTLASACAAGLALGKPLTDAVAYAQDFTWKALVQAGRPGTGQHLPYRSP